MHEKADEQGLPSEQHPHSQRNVPNCLRRPTNTTTRLMVNLAQPIMAQKQIVIYLTRTDSNDLMFSDPAYRSVFSYCRKGKNDIAFAFSAVIILLVVQTLLSLLLAPALCAGHPE